MGKEALRLFPVWYEHKPLSMVSSASTVEMHITFQLFWISHLCLWLTRCVETGFKAAWLCAGDTKPPTEKGLPLNQNTKHKRKCHPTDKACPHFYPGPGVSTHVNFHSKCNGGDILEQMWWMTQRWRHPDRGHRVGSVCLGWSAAECSWSEQPHPKQRRTGNGGGAGFLGWDQALRWHSEFIL